jgi:hypothetical protein
MSNHRKHSSGQYQRRKRRFSIPSVLAFLLCISAFGASCTSFDTAPALYSRLTAFAPGSGCNIKGNISINSGERIYHVPGQRRYRETKIRPEYGERWFCSEAEARQAGWRRARE